MCECYQNMCVTAEGAHLLGCLIHSAPRLVMPYVGPILKALVSKLRSASLPLIIHPSPQVTHMQKGPVQGGGETGVMASVLATTGELARVAGSNLRPHIGDILPLIIEAIGHPSGANKSVVAVVTLGQVSGILCSGSAMHCSHAIGSHALPYVSPYTHALLPLALPLGFPVLFFSSCPERAERN